MSYCRWSSNDYRCDIYCYEGANGFTIHVAASRHTLTDDDLPPKVGDPEDLEGWLARQGHVMDIIRTAERLPIGLPHDGEHFLEPDAGRAADRLESLRDEGYNVPQYAIDELRAEANP